MSKMAGSRKKTTTSSMGCPELADTLSLGILVAAACFMLRLIYKD